MSSKGLTVSIIFDAFGANYSENIGNITELKKVSRGDGNMYSYISRQALRYNIVQQLGWDYTPVVDENKVVQFAPSATIKDYPEIDLFGYMKTKSGSGADTRAAVARLSNAVALEPFNGDMDYLTNMGLARRKDFANAIAQSEIHKSFYAYTITIDLDKVGVEKNVKGEIIIEISNEQKTDRVNKLLSALRYLYRDVKGRRENLSPVFIIGGIYDRKNPFFEGRLKLNKGKLNAEIINSVLNSDNRIKECTSIGYIGGIFVNDNEIKEKLCTESIESFFAKLSKKVEEYYNVEGNNYERN